MAKPGELTPKQQAFVLEYLKDTNATQAAIRAGYSERTAPQQGPRLLENVGVAAAISASMAKRAKRVEVSADRILQELTRIAFADVRNLFVWDEERACYVPSRELTDDEAAAIQSVKSKTTRFTSEDGTEKQEIHLELKTYDKLSALEKIMKHLGMFIERSEHSEVRDITVRFVHE